MALFHRPQRADVGYYETPPRAEIAPIQRVVDEGVLISTSAVRMAVKNRLIVSALRGHHNYDPTALAVAAAHEFTALARQNDQMAERLDQRHGQEDAVDGAEDEEHTRRPLLLRQLALALRREATDREHLRDIVERAREDAWHEVGRAISSRLRSQGFNASGEPDYNRDRAERIRALITIDLAALRQGNALASFDFPKTGSLDIIQADPPA